MFIGIYLFIVKNVSWTLSAKTEFRNGGSCDSICDGCNDNDDKLFSTGHLYTHTYELTTNIKDIII